MVVICVNSRLQSFLQEGDFEMKHVDRMGWKTFNVVVAPFLLSILGDDADAF